MSTNENIAGATHDWISQVRDQVGSLRYGEIRITVHESRVTQIERTERLRLDAPTSSPARSRKD